MNYEQASQFLSELTNYEQRSPSRRDLSLESIRALLNALGNPHKQLFVIHVAGSKGKGSVAAMLERILRHAGYRTGLYTSPPLTCLEERIQVNGIAISPTALAELLGEVHREVLAGRVRDVPQQAPTFFDVVTALAFLYFKLEQVDVVVMEAGMGGRSDSTNICHSKIAVITSISYDHTKQLGNTLTSIAMEKAGIIKPGGSTVSGVTPADARNVIEMTCESRGSTLVQLNTDFSYSYTPGAVSGATLRPSRILISTRSRRWPMIYLNLLGDHQAANAALAIAVVERLQMMGHAISDNAVVTALAQVQWPARIEIIRHRPLVVLDCAHNIASAQALVHTLQTSFSEYARLRERRKARWLLLFAASQDKDLAGILKVLAPSFDHAFLTQYRHSTRSASPEALFAALHYGQVDLPVSFTSDPVRAWTLAGSNASVDDLICVTGSVFLAGELRSLLVSGRRDQQ